MATRFAGDFFGVPLVPQSEQKGSLLLDYFPNLRNVAAGGNQSDDAGDSGARAFGGKKAVTPFAGFKTMETAVQNPKAAPLFTGFKTFEQSK